MDEAGAREEAEAKEPDLARRRLEGQPTVVRRGDVEVGAVEMLRPGGTTNVAPCGSRIIQRRLEDDPVVQVAGVHAHSRILR